MNLRPAKSPRVIAIAAIIAMLAAACTTTPPPPTPEVTDVSIDGGDRTIGVGMTEQLTVTVTASGGASEAVTWSSSNDAAVAVSATGLIEGLVVGSAEITATSVEDPTVSDTIVVTVEAAVAVISVTIDGGDRNVQLWFTEDLTATVVVTGGASQAVTWSSDDATTVTVDVSTGAIEAVGADGSATITATSVANPAISGSIVVNVAALPAPDLDEVFVDASVSAGGNGTAGFPFQTITDGIDLVNPGGIVRVAAGTYAESLHITKALDLLGAGTAFVTIEADGDAPGPFSEAAIDLENVDGVTLSGFRLDVVAPGPTAAAIGMMYNLGSSNVLIENVDIHHTNTARSTRGIWIEDSTGITLRNVNVVADPGGVDHEGAGILIEGDSSAIEFDGVTTTGHESFAGVALVPGDVAATISNLTIVDSTFNEVNKMTMDLTLGGTVTAMDAPVFVAAVGNTSPGYGSGDRFFYKTDLDRAILDALFNFNVINTNTGLRSWLNSTVQTLDATDQSIRENNFVLDRVFDSAVYGWDQSRSLQIQAAIDVAAPGATLVLRAGTFAGAGLLDGASASGDVVDGAVVIDVEGVTITGVGATSIVSATTGPVFTIDADNVTLSGMQIDEDAAASNVTGILMGTGDALTVSGSNLLTDVALDNTAGAIVTAEGNYWGAADGPSGDGPGTGGELVDAGADVDFTPFLVAPVP